MECSFVEISGNNVFKKSPGKWEISRKSALLWIIQQKCILVSSNYAFHWIVLEKNIHLIEFKSNSHRNQTLTFYGNLKTVKHKIELRGGSLMQCPTFKRSSEFLNKLYRFISCNEIKNGQVKPKGGKTVESDVKMRKNADKNVNPKNKWMNEKK